MIDQARDIQRLFLLPFESGILDHEIYSRDEYHMPLEETNDFNALIEYKTRFDEPVKKIAYEKCIQMTRNYDYTTMKFLYFFISSKLI